MRDFEYLELTENREQRKEKSEKRKVKSEQNAGVRRVYHAVGDKLAELAAAHSGKYGYGAFGAVVGCTEREEAAEMRKNYRGLFFLIPGYGVQGGAADDAALLLRNGNGGVVNASRSILKAWSTEIKISGGDEAAATNAFAAEAACRAAVAMRDAIWAADK
jgi:orotidine-5'-phosphate decarboxylase